ncbi:MAG: alpha/beta hydrolase-fold protein [Candidatus Hodarchaeales archaeon]|jgi:enterochelin esterase family protein
MQFKIISAILFLILSSFAINLVFSAVNIVNAQRDFQNFSDFIYQYNNAIEVEQQAVLADYMVWQADNGGFPAIQNNSQVVFIYYHSSSAISSCAVTGDFNSWDESGISMTRLKTGVSFFYKEFSFEPTARLDYKFITGGNNWITDPRNPNKVTGGFGPNSELAMPEFVQPIDIYFRGDIPHGERITLSDPWIDPKVQVYLPPGYNPNGSYPTIYTSDGSEYITLGSAINILDNLIADKRIDPVIAVFIDPKGGVANRITWYNCNPEYLTYLDSLVEYIDNNYATNRSPHARLHLGDSMGGLVSTYVALERPTTFKLIGSHSGAFWVATAPDYNGDYDVKTIFADSTVPDYKAWFSAGTYEQGIYLDTQIMISHCVANGWKNDVIYLYEGHSWGSWRHTLDNMLVFFFPGPELSPTNTSTGTSKQSTSTETDTSGTATPGGTIFGMLGVLGVKGIYRKKKN